MRKYVRCIWNYIDESSGNLFRLLVFDVAAIFCSRRAYRIELFNYPAVFERILLSKSGASIRDLILLLVDIVKWLFLLHHAKPTHISTNTHGQTSKVKYDNSECDTFKSYIHTHTSALVLIFFYSVEVSAYQRSANKEKKSSQRIQKVLCSWEFKVWM